MKVRYYGVVARCEGLATPKDFVDRRKFSEYKLVFDQDFEGRAELAYILPKLKSYTGSRFRYVLFENDDLGGLPIPIEEFCIQETMFDATT